MASDRFAPHGLELLSEEHLRELVHAMPVMLAAFDPFGRILCWNAEAERVTGYALLDLRQASGPGFALETLYPDPMERARIFAEWSHRGNDFRDWRLAITRKDGGRRLVSWTCESDRKPVRGWGCWLIGVEVQGAEACMDFAI